MNRRCCLLLAALTLAPQSSCQESFNTTGDELFGGDFFGSGGMENPCIACPEGLPEGEVDTVVTIDGEDDTCANWINDGFISFLEGGTDYCYLSKVRQAPILFHHLFHFDPPRQYNFLFDRVESLLRRRSRVRAVRNRSRSLLIPASSVLMVLPRVSFPFLSE